MSKGKRVFSSAAYRGDQKSNIVILEYINNDGKPIYYVNEFINDMSKSDTTSGTNRKNKNRIGKTRSSDRAHQMAKEAIDDREEEGWTTMNSVFGGIDRKSEQDRINEFLDKYG